MKHLAIKSLAGLLNLLVVMGAALFLTAGSKDYMAAWYYLAVFFVCVIVITVYIFIYDKQLLQSRLKVGAMAEKRKTQKIIQAIASVGFLGMYLIAGFDYRFGWSQMWPSITQLSLGMVFIAMALLFVVFKHNTYLSATIEVKEQQRTVTTGAYALVRHPMYSAALLLFVFSPLALGSFWALVCLPLMILVLALRSLDEEKALKEELEGYIEYSKKVKYRLVPYIW